MENHIKGFAGSSGIWLAIKSVRALGSGMASMDGSLGASGSLGNEGSLVSTAM